MTKHSEAYNHRDVLTLVPASQWTYAEQDFHLNHNRVLNPSFCAQNPEKLLKYTQLLGEDWITEIILPTIDGALMIHLAKEMAVTFRVHDDGLNQYSHKAYDILKNDNPGLKKEFNDKIDSIVSEAMPNEEMLEKRAFSRLERNNVNRTKNSQPELEITPERIKAVIDIERDLVKRDATHKVVGEYTKSQQPLLSKKLDVGYKEVMPVGRNKDFSFLGPAGSGKSTISRQYLNDKNSSNYSYVMYR